MRTSLRARRTAGHHHGRVAPAMPSTAATASNPRATMRRDLRAMQKSSPTSAARSRRGSRHGGPSPRRKRCRQCIPPIGPRRSSFSSYVTGGFGTGKTVRGSSNPSNASRNRMATSFRREGTAKRSTSGWAAANPPGLRERGHAHQQIDQHDRKHHPRGTPRRTTSCRRARSAGEAPATPPRPQRAPETALRHRDHAFSGRPRDVGHNPSALPLSTTMISPAIPLAATRPRRLDARKPARSALR